MLRQKYLISSLLALWAVVVVLVSCQANNPVGASPAPTATPSGPTSTPTPVSVTLAAGPTYNPSTLNISAGTTVLWNGTFTGHTVDMDNGSGVCSFDITTFPFSYVFSTPGTYHIHCGFHSGAGCGANVCPNPASTCVGMVMTITVT